MDLELRAMDLAKKKDREVLIRKRLNLKNKNWRKQIMNLEKRSNEIKARITEIKGLIGTEVTLEVLEELEAEVDELIKRMQKLNANYLL